MQPDLSGIHQREEVLTQCGSHECSPNGEDPEQNDDGRAVVERPVERTCIALAKLFESAVEDVMHVPDESGAAHFLVVLIKAVGFQFRGEQILHHGRDQRSRKQIGRQHRENHRHGKRCKQILGRSGKQHHRYEHDADGERRDKRRYGDLLRPIENGADQRLLLAEIAVNVLNFDGSVVHQDSHGQRETAQRHHVDGLIEQIENNDRREDGERNRNTNDQRAAPASEEQQDHQTGKNGRDHRFPHHSVDGRPYEQRLIEQRLCGQLRRQRSHDARQRLLHPLHDIERGAAALQNGQHR